MSVRSELFHYGGSGSRISAIHLNEQQLVHGTCVLEAIDGSADGITTHRTLLHPTDDQAEQIANTLDEYLVAIGRREPNIIKWECPSCRARWHGVTDIHGDNVCPGCGVCGRRSGLVVTVDKDWDRDGIPE